MDSIFYQDNSIKIYNGDALDIVSQLESESVNCCVTSPPYWSLRDYGTAKWEGGDPNCDHHRNNKSNNLKTGHKNIDNGTGDDIYKNVCKKCGAIRIDRQIGLEETMEEYIEKIVKVFQEVKRVLRNDGTLWLNLGDSYAGSGRAGSNPQYMKDHKMFGKNGYAPGVFGLPQHVPAGLKPKDLCGIPWRIAFALQAAGWVLRQEIIWKKPNPMPESVMDRCTRCHENVFMFAKAKWIGPKYRQFSFISDQDARWLAMFLDTEGNICAKRARASSGNDHFGAQICLASTSKALVDTAKSIVGLGTVLKRNGKNAPLFYYQLSNIQAADLLYRIYPFVIVKRKQAALGIHLQNVIYKGNKERRTKKGQLRGRLRDDSYTKELIKIWATMKDLNHFGTPDTSWIPEPKYGKWSYCENYYYDAESIKEPVKNNNCLKTPDGWDTSKRSHGSFHKNGREKGFKGYEHKKDKTGGLLGHSGNYDKDGKLIGNGKANKRSVWEVTTFPYPDAHFATFPPDLIKPCILAGCPIGGTVLDPFAGSGTTLFVSKEFNRKSIGIELNQDYCKLILERTQQEVLNIVV